MKRYGLNRIKNIAWVSFDGWMTGKDLIPAFDAVSWLQGHLGALPSSGTTVGHGLYPPGDIPHL